VQIDAEFAQQQLLQGKGAGSIPTASAVLSDVISLLKDYTYSYSKAEANSSKFNPDQLIKVYISSYDKKDLTPFKFKNEIVCGTRKQLEYKIGKLSIKDLKHQFEAQSAKVFVAVFPD